MKQPYNCIEIGSQHLFRPVTRISSSSCPHPAQRQLAPRASKSTPRINCATMSEINSALNDPNHAIELAVGPPFPELKPQDKDKGFAIGGKYCNAPRRYVSIRICRTCAVMQLVMLQGMCLKRRSSSSSPPRGPRGCTYLLEAMLWQQKLCRRVIDNSLPQAAGLPKSATCITLIVPRPCAGTQVHIQKGAHDQ